VTVRFVETARRELAQHLAWLLPLSPDAAARLLDHVHHVLALLDQDAAEGRPVVLKTGRTIRRFAVPPLVLFYDRRGDEVVVRRVRHMSQRPITRH
jgi:plasmid stabilization system protein ParE